MLARGCTDNFLPMKHTWTGLDQIYQIDTSIPLNLWKMKLIHSHIISLSNHVFQNISMTFCIRFQTWASIESEIL